MKNDLKSLALPISLPLDPSRRRQLCRRVRPVVGVALVVLALAVTPQMSYAGSATVTGTTTVTTTLVPSIPTSAGVPRTTFTGYNGGTYSFFAYPFTVSATGTYTATAATTTVVNTTFFLNGLFTPSTTAPTPPYTDFFSAIFSGSSPIGGPYVDNFSNLSLVAGQQYTVLVAFNTQSAGYSGTLTISGPGCIAIGSNTCSAAVATPALSGWAVAALAVMLAATGVWYIRRTQRV